MKVRSSDIDHAKAKTQGVYERQALIWDQQRPKTLFEKPWLDRFATTLRPGGKLLDLGCGSGDPVAEYFLSMGFQIVGVDYSKAMISIARERYPQSKWLVQDMRKLDMAESFDGAYSWDSFFHLSASEQRTALPLFSDKIRTGGGILLTVGPSESEVTGTVAGESVYHASLSSDEYKELLTGLGFQKFVFVPEDKSVYGRSVLMAFDKKAA